MSKNKKGLGENKVEKITGGKGDVGADVCTNVDVGFDRDLVTKYGGKSLLGPCTMDPCVTRSNGNNETPFSFNNSNSIQQ